MDRPALPLGRMTDEPDMVLDETIRGIPPGVSVRLSEIARRRWRPTDGSMTLPLLTLDEAAFAQNRDHMLAYVRGEGIDIAPHAKTPMSPQIARDLVEAGAWGATVANLQQAAVMLRGGITRLILANEVGGAAAAHHLVRLLTAHPDADVFVFVDSPETAAALADAVEDLGASPLKVLVEVGAGRAGARDLVRAERTIAAVLRSDGCLVPAGIGLYEGAAAKADLEETLSAISDLFALGRDAFALLRATIGRDAPLVVTAGGSVYFDSVVAALKPVVETDGRARLVLRSGAIFFHDHGIYARGLKGLEARGGFPDAGTAFRPTLRIWAEVLSRPEPGLAILGMGMRDVSFDQDLPRPLCVHCGAGVRDLASARIVKLNDQHAFLAVDPDDPIAVGEVVELGISHPCTCLDRWRVFFGLNAEGFVTTVYRTFFG